MNFLRRLVTPNGVNGTAAAAPPDRTLEEALDTHQRATATFREKLETAKSRAFTPIEGLPPLPVMEAMRRVLMKHGCGDSTCPDCAELRKFFSVEPTR